MRVRDNFKVDSSGRQLLPANEPLVRIRRGDEVAESGAQWNPPRHLGGYEVQGFNARKWLSEKSLSATDRVSKV